MKTLELERATKTLADYAKSVDREAVLVLRNGRPMAVLSSARGMDAESISLANNPRFVAIIEKSRARHNAEGGVSTEEVRQRLGIPAKKKRRKAS